MSFCTKFVRCQRDFPVLAGRVCPELISCCLSSVSAISVYNFQMARVYNFQMARVGTIGFPILALAKCSTPCCTRRTLLWVRLLRYMLGLKLMASSTRSRIGTLQWDWCDVIVPFAISKVREEYLDRNMEISSVFASPKVFDSVMETYNVALPFHRLVNKADEFMLLDNVFMPLAVSLNRSGRQQRDQWHEA